MKTTSPFPKLPIIILCLYLVAIINSSGCLNLDLRSFQSNYNYKIDIKHKGQISNATFIIPLPVKDNTPMVGPAILTEDDFIKDNISIKLTQSPPDLNFSGLETISCSKPWFLIIQTKQPIIDENYGDVYSFEKRISLDLNTPDFKVNTLRPIGNESIILPKIGFFWIEPTLIPPCNAHTIDYTSVELPQQSRIYADYSAPSSTRVDISCTLRCSNGWYIAREDAYIGNRYQDFIYQTFYGDTQGWYLTEGKFTAADGPYPNFSYSEWQRVLNQTKN